MEGPVPTAELSLEFQATPTNLDAGPIVVEAGMKKHNCILQAPSETTRQSFLLANFNTISLVRLKDPVLGGSQESVILALWHDLRVPHYQSLKLIAAGSKFTTIRHYSWLIPMRDHYHRA